MKLPIQYALYYPERRFLPGERVDFWSIGHLDFEKPDMDTFYGLALAYEAGRCGGTLPTVFNAANELAVSQFLNREIKYLEITEIIEDCMKAHKTIANPTAYYFQQARHNGRWNSDLLKGNGGYAGEKGKPCKAGIRSGDLSPGSEKCPGT